MAAQGSLVEQRLLLSKDVKVCTLTIYNFLMALGNMLKIVTPVKPRVTS